ncbi:hypothetical protein FS837_008786 [Tulasnella sp. UAMH 9824]|nr:hypothetical protein FS837_008786 [Tulasnella sp. UAMH 9824]
MARNFHMDASQRLFHNDFDFGDGNVLVSASGPLDGLWSSPVETVYFRLHISMLEMNSIAFADMFSMPQGNRTGDQPVIHLQDPLDHVIKLFKSIYQGGSWPQGLLSREKWDYIVPVLTLTDKYDMRLLALRLLPGLLEDWPTTLREWDGVDERTRSIVRTAAEQKEQDPSRPSPDDLLPEPVTAIKLGQADPEARSVLPAAFYHLSRISYTRPEGPEDPYFVGPEVFRSANYSLLSSEDWVRLVRGQARIRWWLFNLAEYYKFALHLPPCPRQMYEDEEVMDGTEEIMDSDNEGDEWIPDPCGREDWWYDRVAPQILKIAANRMVDVLENLKSIRSFVDRVERRDDEICHRCRLSFGEWLDESRRKFWMQLPSFFDLGEYPNWGT